MAHAQGYRTDGSEAAACAPDGPASSPDGTGSASGDPLAGSIEGIVARLRAAGIEAEIVAATGMAEDPLAEAAPCGDGGAVILVLGGEPASWAARAAIRIAIAGREDEFPATRPPVDIAQPETLSSMREAQMERLRKAVTDCVGCRPAARDAANRPLSRGGAPLRTKREWRACLKAGGKRGRR